MIIEILGTIGVGKSTFLQKIQDKTGIFGVMEPVETNPWLGLFYQELAYRQELIVADMPPIPMRSTPMMEVYLQSTRKIEITREETKNGIVITDWGRPAVFAKLLREQGVISQLDYRTFRAVEQATRVASDVCILLLGVDFAFDNMHKRGRQCERGVTMGYLQRLEDIYKDIIEREREHNKDRAVALFPWPDDEELATEYITSRIGG